MSFGFKGEYNVRIFFLTQLLNGSGFRGSTSAPTITGNDLIASLILLGIIGKNEDGDDEECCFCWELLVV